MFEIDAPMSDVLVTAIFVAAYVLIATEWIHRVVVALAGAGLMLLFQFLSAEEAFHSERFGIDWNVIFLLFGMMVIVGVLRQTGLFEYLAIWSAKKAGGKPFRIAVMLIIITAVASALLDNVTTILLVVPVTLLIADRLGMSAVPLLVGETMASNIGGTATLIGDPPNIIIGSEANLSYVDFLANLGPLVVILMVVYIWLVKVLFREAFASRLERAEEIMQLDERESLQEGPLLGQALAILGLVTAAFALQGALHYEPSIVALLGAGTLLLMARRDISPFLREVEWQTLLFFAGLFVMVGSLVRVGVISDLADALTGVTGSNLALSVVLLLWISAALSAVIDNIPYVATMAPLVQVLVDSLPGGTDSTVLWWALAAGADLGGNATAIGASANVVMIGLAARSGQPIRFLEFAKYGVVVTVTTVAISTLYFLIRYLA